MDWTKAKTILIVALLATNLFLILTYGLDRLEPEREKRDALLTILENNQITLEGEIPETPGKIPLLYVEYSGITREILQKQIREKSYRTPAGNTGEEELVKAGENFLRDMGLLENTLSFDKITSIGGRKVVQYINQSNGMKVETSYIRLYFRQGILVDGDIYWLEIRETSQKKRNVISPSEALIRFMGETREMERPFTIHGVELVYWLDDSSFEGEGTTIADTALPAWKISFGEDRVHYIYAYEQ